MSFCWLCVAICSFCFGGAWIEESSLPYMLTSVLRLSVLLELVSFGLSASG